MAGTTGFAQHYADFVIPVRLALNAREVKRALPGDFRTPTASGFEQQACKLLTQEASPLMPLVVPASPEIVSGWSALEHRACSSLVDPAQLAVPVRRDATGRKPTKPTPKEALVEVPGNGGNGIKARHEPLISSYAQISNKEKPMKQKRVRLSQEADGKPKGIGREEADVASLMPTLQAHCLSPAIAVDGGPVGRAAMQTSTEGAENKPEPKPNGAPAAAGATEHERRPASPRKTGIKTRSNKKAAKATVKSPLEHVEKPKIKRAKPQLRSDAKSKRNGWKGWSTKLLDGALGLFHKVGSEHNANSKSRKPPGVRAKEEGTPLRRGAATQVMVYPRPKTKAALVRAARKHNQSLSSYLILAGLEKATKAEGCELADLGVPQDELEQYV